MSNKIEDKLKALNKVLDDAEKVVSKMNGEDVDLKMDTTKLMFGDGSYDDIVIETYEDGKKSPKDIDESPKNDTKLGDKLVDEEPICPCDEN